MAVPPIEREFPVIIFENRFVVVALVVVLLVMLSKMWAPVQVGEKD